MVIDLVVDFVIMVIRFEPLEIIGRPYHKSAWSQSTNFQGQNLSQRTSFNVAVGKAHEVTRRQTTGWNTSGQTPLFAVRKYRAALGGNHWPPGGHACGETKQGK